MTADWEGDPAYPDKHFSYQLSSVLSPQNKNQLTGITFTASQLQGDTIFVLRIVKLHTDSGPENDV